ncbi:MAG: disulfide oxidoreductase [Desulfuromonas sp.]|nr:MAG: disulfide oxidoreductase [Desulfuromonas sp.]
MISRDMTIASVIETYPQTVAIFKRFGLDCNECQIASFEAIAGGAAVHKVDIELLMSELNGAITGN